MSRKFLSLVGAGVFALMLSIVGSQSMAGHGGKCKSHECDDDDYCCPSVCCPTECCPTTCCPTYCAPVETCCPTYSAPVASCCEPVASCCAPAASCCEAAPSCCGGYSYSCGPSGCGISYGGHAVESHEGHSHGAEPAAPLPPKEAAPTPAPAPAAPAAAPAK